MSEMEDKLGAILGDPKMMQQIMSMAQALNASTTPPEPIKQQPDPPKPSIPELPKIDPGMLQSLIGLAQSSGMDQNQQHLLDALCPYVSEARVHKLEKAMRAARLASMASSFISAGGLKMLSGR